MKEIPTYEPLLETEFIKKPEWVSSQKELHERMMTDGPRLKPSVKKILLFIGGFMVGLIIGELILYFVVPLF